MLRPQRNLDIGRLFQWSLTALLLASGAVSAQGAEAARLQEKVPAEEQALADEKGRKYRLIEIRKGKEGVDFIRLDDGRIQVRNGIQLDVDSEGAEHFWVRQYEPVAGPRTRPTRKAASAKVAVAITSPLDPASIAFEPSDRLEFTAFDSGLPKTGQWRNGFDLADMDEDGHVDLIFGPARKSRREPNVFLSDGAGNWRRWPGGYPDLPYDYGDAAAADFNRDGHIDFALGIHLSGVVVLVSNGRGSYTEWSSGIGLVAPNTEASQTLGVTDQTVGPVFSSRALEVADWNGDGWPDIVALGEGPKGMIQRARPQEGLQSSPGLRVFLNEGDGTWTTLKDESALFGDSVAVADVNGDGRPDAFTATRQQGARQTLHVQSDGPRWTRHAVSVEPVASFVYSVAIADLDQDGAQDLLLGYIVTQGDTDRTGLDALFGQSSTDPVSWQRVPLFVADGRAGVYSIGVGSLDGDEHLDVAFGTGDGRIEVLLGAGERNFTVERSEELQQPASGCVVYGLKLGDLDKDQRSEVVAAFAGEPAGLSEFNRTAGCLGQGSVRVFKATPRP